MNKPRPLAWKLIEKRYIKKGKTTKIAVLPIPNTGLPEELTNKNKAVVLKIRAGRPVNLQMTENGISGEWCFNHNPITKLCSFPWHAILFVQSPIEEDAYILTTYSSLVMMMEDGSTNIFNTEEIDEASRGIKNHKDSPLKPELRIIR